MISLEIGIGVKTPRCNPYTGAKRRGPLFLLPGLVVRLLHYLTTITGRGANHGLTTVVRWGATTTVGATTTRGVAAAQASARAFAATVLASARATRVSARICAGVTTCGTATTWTGSATTKRWALAVVVVKRRTRAIPKIVMLQMIGFLM